MGGQQLVPYAGFIMKQNVGCDRKQSAHGVDGTGWKSKHLVCKKVDLADEATVVEFVLWCLGPAIRNDPDPGSF